MEDFRANAQVTFRQDLTDNLCMMRIQPFSPPVPSFEPGQYATLGLPRDEPENSADQISATAERIQPPSPTMLMKATASNPPPSPMIRRAYSIVSSPLQRDEIELFIALVPGGHFTPKLWTLRPGSPLWLDPHIHGKFTLAPIPRQADVVMVATGTGIAPYISMLRTYANEHRWRRVAILHGVRQVADLGYRDELEMIARKHANVTYLPTVTREPEHSSWSGSRGRVSALLQKKTFEGLTGWPLNPRQTHVMLCGNPQMIDDVVAELRHLGFDTARDNNLPTIHFERYWGLSRQSPIVGLKRTPRWADAGRATSQENDQ